MHSLERARRGDSFVFTSSVPLSAYMYICIYMVARTAQNRCCAPLPSGDCTGPVPPTAQGNGRRRDRGPRKLRSVRVDSGSVSIAAHAFVDVRPRVMRRVMRCSCCELNSAGRRIHACAHLYIHARAHTSEFIPCRAWPCHLHIN